MSTTQNPRPPYSRYGSVRRGVVSGRVIDALIRSKVASLGGCEGVEPMPVVRNASPSGRCNWTMPGFSGDASRVAACRERISGYLEFLGSQFDIGD